MQQRHIIAFLLLAAFAVTLAHAIVPHRHVQASHHQHSHGKAHHHHHSEPSSHENEPIDDDPFSTFFHTAITGTECAAANHVQAAAAQFFLIIPSLFITVDPGSFRVSQLPSTGSPTRFLTPLAAGLPYFFALKAPPETWAAQPNRQSAI